MMKKLLLFIVVLAVLIALPFTVVVKAQAPTTLMIGGLYQGGDRSLGIWTGASTVAVEDTSLGVKDIIRFGYFYSNNANPDDIQAISILNVIEKTMFELKPGWVWFLSTGAGPLIEISDGEDVTNFAFLLETGVQINDLVKLGFGLHYEAVGGDDRKFTYLILNLFP